MRLGLRAKLASGAHRITIMVIGPPDLVASTVNKRPALAGLSIRLRD
jgi:hypothetical protein